MFLVYTNIDRYLHTYIGEIARYIYHMSVPVQFRLKKDLYLRIKQAARIESVKKDKDYSWQDMLREIIEKKFPEKNTDNASKNNG